MLAMSFGLAFRAHAGAFSRTLRLADAYSTRTLFQSHWSSSATIIAFEVSTPVPISVWLMRMVTVSSGAMVIQALSSGTMASRYHNWDGTCWPATGGGACASAHLGGSQKPTTIAPPTAAVVVRKSRRLISCWSPEAFMVRSRLGVASV